MTPRAALIAAALLMFVAVAAGAFGAHALKSRLAPDMLSTWQTAVLYHALHALGLFGVALLMLHWPERSDLSLAAWLMIAGIVLFSGSLYALALSGIRPLGAITPFGGLSFLLAWLVVAWAALRT
jgi:uncharacterized membrane protein YgdD (TMEM256/DUF423 family)